MRTPFIHSNGTTAQGLLDQITTALSCLRVAIFYLERAAPHMRDYYPYSDCKQAFTEAWTEHGDRLRRIESVIVELEELAEYVSDKIT